MHRMMDYGINLMTMLGIGALWIAIGGASPRMSGIGLMMLWIAIGLLSDQVKNLGDRKVDRLDATSPAEKP